MIKYDLRNIDEINPHQYGHKSTHWHNTGYFDPVHFFFQNKMQLCTASSQLLLACFPT